MSGSGGKLRITILGCGSSPGTPRIHGEWGACDPNEPRNRRLRASLLVERVSETGRTTVVVDTGPDFRQQMLAANVKYLDGVLYTHAHADHIHGIDDLRGFALAQRKLMAVYCDEPTSQRLMDAFGYCFKTPEGSMYPPILTEYRIEAEKPVVIDGAGGEIVALPILQIHGPITSLGFRFFSSFEDCRKQMQSGQFTGGFCYSPDVSDFPDETRKYLAGLDWWIIDALQYKPHISHLSLEEALGWIDTVKPGRAALTHMHIPLDYQTLKKELPGHIEPGFDGMVIELPI